MDAQLTFFSFLMGWNDASAMLFKSQFTGGMNPMSGITLHFLDWFQIPFVVSNYIHLSSAYQFLLVKIIKSYFTVFFCCWSSHSSCQIWTMKSSLDRLICWDFITQITSNYLKLPHWLGIVTRPWNQDMAWTTVFNDFSPRNPGIEIKVSSISTPNASAPPWNFPAWGNDFIAEPMLATKRWYVQ